MAQLGIMTTEFHGGTLDQNLAELATHGVRLVQLQLGSATPNVPLTDSLLRGLDVLGPRLTPAFADHVHASLQAHQLTVAAVDGTYNMVHPDRARRFANLRHLQALIDIAPRLGTRIVTLCTGSRSDIMWAIHPGNHEDSAWRDLTEQVTVAVRAAEAAGIVLAFEPEHSNVVDSAASARRLLDEIGSPALKVVFDPANIFHTGDLARMTAHLEEAVALLGPDIALVHAKDLDHDGAAGGLAAGRGLLDYALVLRLLQEAHYDGGVVLHGLHGLSPAEIDGSLDHVRSHGPNGYLT